MAKKKNMGALSIRLRPKKVDRVRFQVSLRTRLKPFNKKMAQKAVMDWLDNGKQPEGVNVQITIWQGPDERMIDANDVGQDYRGSILRETIRRALQDGRLSIGKIRKD